jgi:hypothetical protein
MFEDADLIHRYTRADAIRDGVLIDVTETAREAGIRWPVALTSAVWGRCVTVPAGVVCQDEAGRLWDVLFLLALAARRSGGAGSRSDGGVGRPPCPSGQETGASAAAPALPCRRQHPGRPGLEQARRSASSSVAAHASSTFSPFVPSTCHVAPKAAWPTLQPARCRGSR